MSRSVRRGFTLVELLVVIAIIGVLVAMLLPAVQMARESARSRACMTNLRELGQAAIMFEDAKRRYPGWQEITARNVGAPLSIHTVFSGAGGGANKVAGWNVHLLPYLDQDNLFELWEDQTVDISAPQLASYLPIYACPSRESKYRVANYTSYVANAGVQPTSADSAPFSDPNVINKVPPIAGASNDYWDFHQGHNGVFVDRVPIPNGTNNLNTLVPKLPEVKSSDVKDGLANTLLFTENLLGGLWGPTNPAGYGTSGPGGQTSITFTWHYRYDGNVTCATPPTGPYLPGASAPDMRINGNKKLHRDPTAVVAADAPFLARPSAWHSGGVNAVFADKHTAFLRDGMDYDVYQQLMTTEAKKSHSYSSCYVLRAEDYE